MKVRLCTVYFNDETGEMCPIQWKEDAFDGQSALMAADVLSDLAEAAADAYDDANERFCLATQKTKAATTAHSKAEAQP